MAADCPTDGASGEALKCPFSTVHFRHLSQARYTDFAKALAASVDSCHVISRTKLCVSVGLNLADKSVAYVARAIEYFADRARPGVYEDGGGDDWPSSRVDRGCLLHSGVTGGLFRH